MKQKYLVINCNENDVDSLRQRLGERPFVTCESLDEIGMHLPTNESAVFVSSNQPAVEQTVNGEISEEVSTTNGDVEILCKVCLCRYFYSCFRWAIRVPG